MVKPYRLRTIFIFLPLCVALVVRGRKVRNGVKLNLGICGGGE